MKMIGKIISIEWLVFLSSFLTLGAQNSNLFFVPSTGLCSWRCHFAEYGYDANAQLSIAYDKASSPVSNYDFFAMLTLVDGTNRTVGASSLSAKLAKFLAAEGGAPLFSTTSGSGMDSTLFRRIQAAFQRNGGVMQADAESTRLLNVLKVEVATPDATTVLLKQNPSTSAVYEELIHTAQLRAGMTDPVEMEIQAAQKLIRFADQYNIPAEETQQTINRLNTLLQQGQ